MHSVTILIPANLSEEEFEALSRRANKVFPANSVAVWTTHPELFCYKLETSTSNKTLHLVVDPLLKEIVKNVGEDVINKPDNLAFIIRFGLMDDAGRTEILKLLKTLLQDEYVWDYGTVHSKCPWLIETAKAITTYAKF